MIEKLKVVMRPEDWNLPVNELEMRCLKNVLLKIDELVDAVNELQKHEEQHLDLLTELNEMRLHQKEPTDPYAEQRKWIGKVCWFWDDDNTNSSCGILTSIDTETFKEPQFVCNDEYDYEHCEPVKPDDDIIYKGE